MKLSVIVPVHNAENYLSRCLDSLLKQDVDSYEIICVENGSKDGSLALLRQYEKDHKDVVRVLVAKEVGVSNARNYGMQMAQGEILAFCDADDYLIPGGYGYLLKTYWNDKIDVLKFNSITLDEHVLKTWEEPNDVHGKILYEGNSRSFMRAVSGVPTFVWCNLYRQSFLKEKGLHFEPLMVAEDILFNINVYMADANVLSVSSNIYRYTVSPEQVTRKREPERMKTIVRGYLTVFETLARYKNDCSEYCDVLCGIMEGEMLSCFSRFLSACFSRKEFVEMRRLYADTGVFSMKKKRRISKIIDCAMQNYCTYYVASFVHRRIFVPYVLPRMSRN